MSSTPLTTPSTKHGHTRMLKFLTHVEHALSGKTSHEGCKIGRRIIDDPDYNMPFRDRAQSRAHVLAHPQGIFQKRHAKNVQGVVFSALHFRAAGYRTESVLDHSGFFEDYDAWLRFYDPQNHKESYYCNKSAYGATDCRGVHNIEPLWKETPSLVAFLQRDPSPSFSEVQKFICNGPFPTFGNLCAYLVTGDLAKGGLVKLPSLTELGRMVHTLKKGAIGGLYDLGLVEPGASIEQVADAFVLLHKYIQESITSAQKESWGYDETGLMLEHALCKYRRLRVCNASCVHGDDVTKPLTRVMLANAKKRAREVEPENAEVMPCLRKRAKTRR